MVSFLSLGVATLGPSSILLSRGQSKVGMGRKGVPVHFFLPLCRNRLDQRQEFLTGATWKQKVQELSSVGLAVTHFTAGGLQFLSWCELSHMAYLSPHLRR